MGRQASPQVGEWGGPGKTLEDIIPVPRPSIPGMSSPNLQDRVVRASGQEKRSGGVWGGVHALDRRPLSCPACPGCECVCRDTRQWVACG